MMPPLVIFGDGVEGSDMVTLYIASNQVRAGKTAVCVTLAHRLGQEGKKVALFKPLYLQVHVDEHDPDAQILRQAAGVQGSETALWPLSLSRYGDLLEIPVERALQAFPEATAGADVSIVEGLSGLTDSLGSASSQIAAALDAKVVVVIRYTSSDQAKQDALNASHLFGDRLAGVLINGVTRYRLEEVEAQLVSQIEAERVKVLAVVPEDRRLLGITVGQLARHLDGRFLNHEDKEDNLVERFLIGGMTVDWGVLHYERFSNKAIVVRGDRPDLQMAVLETPSSCMVLTGGHAPLQYVSLRAEEVGVPLIQIDADIPSAVATLESVQEKALFDHPVKQEQFNELVTQRADWEALRRSLGI